MSAFHLPSLEKLLELGRSGTGEVLPTGSSCPSAVARSLRPGLPGAPVRGWGEGREPGQEVIAGLQGHWAHRVP